jgi:hypothetical protein
MPRVRADLAQDGVTIPVVGTKEWLSDHDLIGSSVVQQNLGEVIVRLANGDVVIVNSIDLDFEENNA